VMPALCTGNAESMVVVLMAGCRSSLKDRFLAAPRSLEDHPGRTRRRCGNNARQDWRVNDLCNARVDETGEGRYQISECGVYLG
jgi:hypothetical protein